MLFLVGIAVSASADVKYIGTDTDTQGEWEGKYGKDGVVIFDAAAQGAVDPAPAGDNDLVREGLISHYETPDGQRFRWTRGALAHHLNTKSLDGEDQKLNAVAFTGGQVHTVIEVDAAQYQVAAYYGGNENSRVQSIYGYLGDSSPDDPDVEVSKFGNGGNGVYVIWEVTAAPNEPFTIRSQQIGPVNAVISGVFVDVVDAPVESAGKLSVTWGQIKHGR
jgi:hypothetical protein